MEIRKADLRDRPAIRDVARRSLQASYSLEPSAIAAAIRKWYDEDHLAEALSDEDKLLLVVDVDGQVVGFSESLITDDDSAQLSWLHIDPFHRGENYGEALFKATQDHLEAQGITTLQGRVLADNRDGPAFYEGQGLSKVGESEVEIDGENHIEYIYANIEARGIEPQELDGETRYVDYDNTKTGSFGPFYPIYNDQLGQELYGNLCSNCGHAPVGMDTMGRLKCDECNNASRPTRWDAAYL